MKLSLQGINKILTEADAIQLLQGEKRHFAGTCGKTFTSIESINFLKFPAPLESKKNEDMEAVRSAM